jgi:hypothetical protein
MQIFFDNPIFIFIIIGIISMIKKMKESNNQNQKQDKEPEWEKEINYPHTFNEDRQEKQRLSTEKAQKNSKLAQEFYHIEKNSDITLVNKQTNARKDATPPRKDNAQMDVVIKSGKDDRLELSPSKEKVIDGVIWAEILGPPRAIKSHSQKRAAYRR